MAELDYNRATKKVSFTKESLQDLSPEDRLSAEETTTLVNLLMSNLVAHNNDLPPPQGTLTAQVSASAAKLANTGVQALKENKLQVAVKLLSTALETVLRRSVWESPQRLIDEIALCLMPRCDAYVSLKQFADAYADASLLMLMKPTEHINYYRKGMILLSAGRVEEAQTLVQSALSMAPNNPLYMQALASMAPRSRK